MAQPLHQETGSQEENINWLAVARALLRIVARWDETGYTGPTSFMSQNAESQLDTLANPARANDTAQD